MFFPGKVDLVSKKLEVRQIVAVCIPINICTYAGIGNSKSIDQDIYIYIHMSRHAEEDNVKIYVQ